MRISDHAKKIVREKAEAVGIEADDFFFR